MLKLLHIENIAVIEKADIEFSAGLNVLTGETGAGKSIIIDSLTAVIGGRTSRDLLRTGATSASVTAVFTCDDLGALPETIEPDENGEIYVLRRIAADGKSACRINGAPVQAAALRELGSALLDIHGQNDGRKLLDESAHLGYLDVYGNLSDERAKYKAAYDILSDKKKQIDKLNMDEGEKERRLDALKYQIQEIESAELNIGEYAQLAARREMLLNASKLTQSVETAFESLYGGGEMPGAVELISAASSALDNASRFSGELGALGERLGDIKYTAQDISEELRDFRARLEFSPSELDALETRLDTLGRIMRRYGSTASPGEAEEEVLKKLEDAKNELADIDDSTGKLAKLEKEHGAALAEAKRLAGELSDKRKKAANRLEEQVKNELAGLSMPGVKFIVDFDGAPGEHGLDSDGCDTVRYLMSANAGEAPGRINRIASGGELARIMLALKNALSGATDVASMVFDEIDTGVSGIAAQRVGEKLATLAKGRQVLCVTHLPQIAVMADTHFSITKSVSDGRTYTHVEELNDDGRQREIARLSGGENISETTLASAAEQLKAAQEFKRNIKR